MALSLLSATAAQSQSSRITEVTSPGGIKAWLVHDTTLPLIAVEFAFLGGASQDGKDLPGLANLTASLLDEGAGTLDAAAFQSALADHAVELHFDAGRDEIRGSLRTLSEHREKAFDLMRLAVSAPRFDTEAVERIRAAQMAMLRRRSTEPNAIANERWFTLAFPDHPYGRPVDGTLETVARISRDDIAGFARRTLARSNLRVAVVGDISAEELGQRLDAVFGTLPATAPLTPVANVEPQKIGTVEVIPLDVSQSVVVMGTGGLERRDPDFIPAFVLNHILGGSAFSSRLFKEVREARGLAYSVYSYQVALGHTGLWFAGTATKNERAGESIAIITDEFRKILKDGPSQTELDEAKSYLMGSYALRFDTSSKVAGQLLQIQLDELGIDYVDRRNALIAAVTLDYLKRVAARLATARDALVVVVGKPVGLGG
ncbi:M16 family metallopeptidase [Xanthobacter autotrophicus]|uniref:M16 family metallopeptidase n=1 Tax=Xanthobacter autotrophicus TaxID=280 RepID=UPI0024A6C208|nr:pitrilysin family protein [Xanthobacter autotrophicus]MDI4657657.1 insulinase family protein [Xanthobacter autotrophicus]